MTSHQIAGPADPGACWPDCESVATGGRSPPTWPPRARVTALEGVATAMLGCVRSLMLDVDELGAPELKARLAQLVVQLR